MKKIVAIGDSIVWGQGLEPEDKFTRIVARELPAELSEALDLSHSGAVIGGNPQSSQHKEKPRGAAAVSTSPFRGEIPNKLPTIISQINDIAKLTAPKEIDILLMDGGANDAGFDNVLSGDKNDFRRFLHATARDVTSHCRFALKAAKETCPNALIVYTGYFAGLSEESNLESETDEEIAKLTFVPSILLNILSLGSGELLKDFLGWLSDMPIETVKKNAVDFHYELIRALKSAIADFNMRQARESPTPTIDIVFVDPSFKPSNAMFTPDSLLHDLRSFSRRVAEGRTNLYWSNTPSAQALFTLSEATALINKSPSDAFDIIGDFFDGFKDLDNFNPFDGDVFSDNKEEGLFDNTVNKTKARFTVWKNINAHLAHPNRAGARQYADKTLKAIRENLNLSLRETLGNYGTKSMRTARDSKAWIAEPGRVSLRKMFRFSRLESIDVRFTYTEMNVWINTTPIRVKVDWGKGYHNMREMALMREKGQTASGEEGFLSFDGSVPIHSLKKLSVALFADGNKQSGNLKFRGRVAIRINGYVVYKQAVSHKWGSNETSFTQGLRSLTLDTDVVSGDNGNIVF